MPRGIEIELTIPGTGRRIALPRVEPGNAEAATAALEQWLAGGEVEQKVAAAASAVLEAMGRVRPA